MDQSQTTQRTVIVKFDDNTKTVSFDGTAADGLLEIEVLTEIGGIVFYLDHRDYQNHSQAGTSVPAFPSAPIQWVDAQHLPINPPPGATATRSSNVIAKIEVVRSQVVRGELRFYVLVQQDGRFYGTDPTIVTMPSGGGSGQHS